MEIAAAVVAPVVAQVVRAVVAAAVPLVHLAVPVALRAEDASRSGKNATSTRQCRLLLSLVA